MGYRKSNLLPAYRTMTTSTVRFFTLCAFVLTVACRNETVDPVSSPNVVHADQVFTMAPGETVTLEGENLSIRFVRVTEDSRCPVDVQCVWAGNGQIEVVTRIGDRRTTFRLNTMQNGNSYAIPPFVVRLNSLSPAPHSGQQIPAESYRAQLTVTKS